MWKGGKCKYRHYELAKLNTLNSRKDVKKKIKKKSVEGQERWNHIYLPIMNKHKSHLPLQVSARKWKRSIPSSTIQQFIFSSFLISQAGSQDLYAWVNPSILWGQTERELALFPAEGGRGAQVSRGNEVIDRLGLAPDKLPWGKHPSPTVIVCFILRAAIPPGSFW